MTRVSGNTESGAIATGSRSNSVNVIGLCHRLRISYAPGVESPTPTLGGKCRVTVSADPGGMVVTSTATAIATAATTTSATTLPAGDAEKIHIGAVAATTS